MGGASSVPTRPAFVPDLAAATFNGAYVAQELEHASKFAEDSRKAINKLWWTRTVWFVGFLLVLGPLLVALIWYTLYQFKFIDDLFGVPRPVDTPPPTATPTTINTLVITSATFSTRNGIQLPINIKPQLQSLIIDGALNVTLNHDTISNIPISAISDDIVKIAYYYVQCQDKKIFTRSVPATTFVSITLANTCTKDSSVGSSSPVTAPNWFSSFFAGQGSSGNLLPNTLDTTTSTTVKASSAPLSSGNDGAYGMQWWMFIKDWNYGYGKDKQVLTRVDPTNSSILNPSVSLHPTDNSLRVSISIFPDSPDGSSKATPAPAGHSGATDDVFVCEVPNLPLQDWFAVSMTVSGRNLDVYIDGKLVKSCFLPGVPKPASGDITVAGAGGFSGSMCGFKHYSRMLTPGDAVNFSGNGTNCKASTGPSDVSKATGYSVKFGMYDNVGKKVEEYTF